MPTWANKVRQLRKTKRKNRTRLGKRTTLRNKAESGKK